MLDKFQKDVIEKVADANALQPKYEQPKTSRLKVAKCRPSRGCCADKKDKHNHNKPAESSDSRLVFFIMVFDYLVVTMSKLLENRGKPLWSWFFLG